MGFEFLIAFSQQLTLPVTHTEHHLGILVQYLIALRQITQILHDHVSRGLDLDGLFQGVIGFDVTTVQGLAVVTAV